MFSWLGLAKIVFSLAQSVARIIGDKQLIDAGEAKATADQLGKANDQIARAIAARRAVRHDPDSILHDRDNRDNQ